MKKLLAASAALAVLATGCAVHTTRATNVKANSATLNASVRCNPGALGQAWWELREAGGAWKVIGGRSTVTCPASNRAFGLAQNVAFLRAGKTYEYRVAADPAKGGHTVRSNATSFTTPGVAADRFSPGIVSSADHSLSARAAGALGSDHVRVEFAIGTPVAQMRSTIADLAGHGARALLLAGFDGRIPSQAEAQNLGNWAAEFGPGGRFWTGRGDGRLAVQQIEFGNETSYGHQYGDSYAAASYRDRARAYATRFAQARAAIGLAGRKVGLLAQADDGGSGSSAWVDSMFDAVPNLGQIVDGWTVHPYGPRSRWEPKLDRLIAQTKANGAPASIPIDVTEYGISSANGKPLTDNYGWPTNLTYAQAAAALDATIAEMRADPTIGPRLRDFMIYAAHDLRPAGSSAEREQNFGVLQNNLGAKGAYSTEVKDQLDE
jgi:hypothetical protein